MKVVQSCAESIKLAVLKSDVNPLPPGVPNYVTCFVASPAQLLLLLTARQTVNDHPPTLPYIVLDQNKCRNGAAMRRLFQRCRRSRLQILLTDMAMYEFSNVSRPDITWKRSLEHLCKEPSLVVVGRSVGEMMKEEVHSHQPKTEIVDHALTARFQQLLVGVRNDDDAQMKATLDNVKRLIRKERRKRNRHDRNKSILQNRVQWWEKFLSPARLRRLRQLDRMTLVRILSDLNTSRLVYNAAKRRRCSNITACRLTVGPSVFCYSLYALEAFALDWLARGGLQSARATDISNDFFDMDYVVSALFCAGLATYDGRAKRVHSALLTAMKDRWRRLNAMLKAHQAKR